MPFNQPIDITTPADTDFVRFGALAIRNLTAGIKERFDLEHQTLGDGSGDPNSSSAEGRHIPGHTSVVYQGTTAQISSQTPNGVGCIAFDTTLNLLKVWNGSTWTAVNEPVSVPSGAIMGFGMAAVPTGWLYCDGSEVSRTTYADLFTAIFDIYGGGDGISTFNLPDFRGAFLRGFGTNSEGTSSGSYGTLQTDEFESHTHVYNKVEATANTGGGGSTKFGIDAFSLATTIARGGGETRPKNFAVNYCIKI